MNYEQALDFIHGIARFGSKPGLRRITMLLERMGNPQDKLRFVHVAGTNGKGSTCTMISHALVAAGYRTGLYISPFVEDFRERIQLDNEMIARDELVESVAVVKQHWDALDAAGETPTEFEVVVAVAMDYFVRMAVDVVVLEVGMGGRFDATNAIGPPLVSVITALSLEHTEYLGNTLAEIALEKCGIIKDPGDGGGVCVCYPRQPVEALEVIMRRCAEEQNALVMPVNAENVAGDLFGNRFRYQNIDVDISLGGPHQVLNAITAMEALFALRRAGFGSLTDEAVRRGLGAARMPSRLEVLGRDPLIILDGAHNPDGARVLHEALQSLPGRRIHAVVGVLGNKDVAGVLGPVLPHCATATAVAAPDSPGAMPPRELAELARGYCEKTCWADDPVQGLRDAYAFCGPEDVLLVCGSLYLASHLRPALKELGGGRDQRRGL